jgi:hypothetical protein
MGARPHALHRNDDGHRLSREVESCGLDAFTALKRQFGGSNLLNTVRKNYAFHYPRSDDVDRAFESICNDPELSEVMNLYFSHHGFNSLFFLSDLVFLQGIADAAKHADLAATQRKLMSDVSSASSNLIEFAKAFVAATWIKHFGAEMQVRW